MCVILSEYPQDTNEEYQIQKKEKYTRKYILIISLHGNVSLESEK